MQANRRVSGIAVVEVFAFEHLSHCELAHEFGHLAERELTEPFTVVMNFDLIATNDLEELFLVFLCVFENLFVAKARTSLVSTARVTNLCGVVAHDEHDGMAQILELAELTHHDRMAKVNVRSRWVHTHLDTERFTRFVGLLEFLFEFILRHNIDDAAHQNFKLFFYRTELHFRF